MFNRLFQLYILDEGDSNELIFHLSIGSATKSEIKIFHPYAPAIKYVQHDKNNSCLISLLYGIFDSIEHVAEQETTSWLKSYLFFEPFGYMDMINFAIKIMTDRVRIKGEKCRHYDLVKWKPRQ